MKFHLLFRVFAVVFLLGLAAVIGMLFSEQTLSASPPAWIAGLLTALAAIFALVLGKVGDLWLQQEVAEQNRREMCAALWAEIAIKLEQQSEAFAKRFREQTFDRLKDEFEAGAREDQAVQAAGAGEPDHALSKSRSPAAAPTSSVPVGEGNLVLDAVKGHIFKLPTTTIEPTVRYYTFDAMLDVAIRGTHEAEFQRALPELQARRWNRIYLLGQKTEEAGFAALDALAISKGRSTATPPTIVRMEYDEDELPLVLRDTKEQAGTMSGRLP